MKPGCGLMNGSCRFLSGNYHANVITVALVASILTNVLQPAEGVRGVIPQSAYFLHHLDPERRLSLGGRRRVVRWPYSSSLRLAAPAACVAFLVPPRRSPATLFLPAGCGLLSFASQCWPRASLRSVCLFGCVCTASSQPLLHPCLVTCVTPASPLPLPSRPSSRCGPRCARASLRWLGVPASCSAAARRHALFAAHRTAST
jgi:hypothetical protein